MDHKREEIMPRCISQRIPEVNPYRFRRVSYAGAGRRRAWIRKSEADRGGRTHCNNASLKAIRNSRHGLEAFIMYLQGTGKSDLKEIGRGAIERFVEDEQDQGLKLSTVKTRLAQARARNRK